MRVLVACEFSGRVREAFRRKGHYAVSCDLLPSELPGRHYQRDIFEVIGKGWDLLIAHPPCTYLTISLAWCYYNPEDKHLPVEQKRPHPKFPDRRQRQADSIQFFNKLWNCGIDKICVENPIPLKILKETVGSYSQIIQPWWFGEDASKQTCLWLKDLPLLVATNILKKKQYANQTPSGQNKVGPSVDRWKLRSLTYLAVAEAMAEQWG